MRSILALEQELVGGGDWTQNSDGGSWPDPEPDYVPGVTDGPQGNYNLWDVSPDGSQGNVAGTASTPPKTPATPDKLIIM